ncbi:MAG: MurR/RpiR family transcriptional regulator [Anaerolineales bacterium]|nr:MurR/RpiR family transcriptional regulator [Anaerolineales bacterium]
MQDTSTPSGDFSQIISDHYDELTKSEKRIADFMRQNQDEATFLSASEIAERLELSEATMVRFARSLGFDSYPALRTALQEKFRHIVTHSARLRSRLDELHVTGDIFERLVASEINFLTESLQTLDRNAFNQAVELLRTHQRVFVFGLGPSISLVDLLEIRLTRSARHVIPLRVAGKEMLEPLLLMGKDDLLIAIGFINITPPLKIVIEQANLHKTPVILVTDTLGPLVGDKATVTLAARRGPVSAFHSLTVPMTLINALLLALSSVDQERVMANLDKLDQLRHRFAQTNGSLSR